MNLEEAAATFPLLRRGTLACPFPHFGSQVRGRELFREEARAGWQGRAGQGGGRLPAPAVTYLRGPIGIRAQGRARPGLAQEGAGPKAAGGEGVSVPAGGPSPPRGTPRPLPPIRTPRPTSAAAAPRPGLSSPPASPTAPAPAPAPARWLRALSQRPAQAGLWVVRPHNAPGAGRPGFRALGHAGRCSFGIPLSPSRGRFGERAINMPLGSPQTLSVFRPA